MNSQNHSTIVIFRKSRKEIVALFPCHPGTNDPNTCLGYVHTGQHIDVPAANHGWTKATPEEYAPLKRELESIGYVLTVKTRSCSAYRKTRVRAI